MWKTCKGLDCAMSVNQLGNPLPPVTTAKPSATGGSFLGAKNGSCNARAVGSGDSAGCDPGSNDGAETSALMQNPGYASSIMQGTETPNAIKCLSMRGSNGNNLPGGIHADDTVSTDTMRGNRGEQSSIFDTTRSDGSPTSEDYFAAQISFPRNRVGGNEALRNYDAKNSRVHRWDSPTNVARLHALAQREQNVERCKTGALIGVSRERGTAIVVPLSCKSWLCDRCRQTLRRHWEHVALAGEPERFITLTCDPKKYPSPLDAFRGLSRAFNRLCISIRKKYGKFEFLRVWELHKSGWPHLHILQRGSYIPQEWLSSEWERLGGGPIVDIRKINDQSQTTKYIVKYMGKQFAELQRLWTGTRLISKSRGWVCNPAKLVTKKILDGYQWAKLEYPLWRILSDLALCGGEVISRNAISGVTELDLRGFVICKHHEADVGIKSAKILRNWKYHPPPKQAVDSELW
jgi:hypothetical protein